MGTNFIVPFLKNESVNSREDKGTEDSGPLNKIPYEL